MFLGEQVHSTATPNQDAQHIAVIIRQGIEGGLGGGKNRQCNGEQVHSRATPIKAQDMEHIAVTRCEVKGDGDRIPEG